VEPMTKGTKSISSGSKPGDSMSDLRERGGFTPRVECLNAAENETTSRRKGFRSKVCELNYRFGPAERDIKNSSPKVDQRRKKSFIDGQTYPPWGCRAPRNKQRGAASGG